MSDADNPVADNPVEGSLEILLRPTGAGCAVAIHSSRPLLASRLFEGRSVDETLRSVPLIFNVCGLAQGVAAVRAVESALATPAAADIERRREAVIRLEILREHLWRVVLDWPAFLDTGGDSSLLSRLMALIQTLKVAMDPHQALINRPGLQHADGIETDLGAPLARLRQTIADEVLGAPPGDWLAFDSAALWRWAERSATMAARLLRHLRDRGWADLGAGASQPMPALDGATLAARLDADDADEFIASPRCPAGDVETGPAARRHRHPLMSELCAQRGPGLLARLVARLLEIAQIAAGLDEGLESAADSIGSGAGVPGLSQVEAARGRLCHRVQLSEGRVSRYRILAPTEWNFRPDGPAAQALAGLRGAPDSLRHQARLLIHAIDPCVGYRLSIERP